MNNRQSAKWQIFLWLAGTAFALSLFAATGHAAVTPWLSGWKHRKLITVTGSTAGAQTDYQLPLTLHYGAGTDTVTDIYLAGKCQADFSDIRFTTADGTTDLNWWTETATIGDNVAVWVKVPTVPASPTTVTGYLYYGNSATGSTFRLALCADAQGDNTDSGTQSRSMGLTWTQEFATWNNNVYSPDAVVNLGDITLSDTVGEAQTNLAAIQGAVDAISGASHAAVCGNHDVDQLSLAQFLAVLSSYTYWQTGKGYGSFDVLDYHFVILDSCYNSTTPFAHSNAIKGYIPDGTDGSDDEIGWLTADLAATSKKTIVFSHHGLGEMNMIGNGYFNSTPANAFVSNRAAVRTILENSGKGIGVFSGHVHQGCWITGIKGIPYITIPAITDKARRITAGNKGTWATVDIDDWKKTLTLKVYEDDSGLGVQEVSAQIFYYAVADTIKKASNPMETFSNNYIASGGFPDANFGGRNQFYVNATAQTDGYIYSNLLTDPYIGSRASIPFIQPNTASVGSLGMWIGNHTVASAGYFTLNFQIRKTVNDLRAGFYLNNKGVAEVAPGTNYGSANAGPYLDFRDNGQIAYYDGSFHDLQAYSANTWYKIKLLVDMANRTFAIKVDDTWYPTGGSPTYSWWSTSVTQLNAFCIRKPTANVATNVVYYDDIRLQKYADPEPAFSAVGGEEKKTSSYTFSE